MSNGQSSPNYVRGQIPTATQWNNDFAGKQDANVPIQSAASTLSIAASGDYAYSGSSAATWTLPLLLTAITPIDVINMGTGILTIDCAGEDVMYDGGEPVTSKAVLPGFGFSWRNYASTWAVE